MQTRQGRCARRPAGGGGRRESSLGLTDKQRRHRPARRQRRVKVESRRETWEHGGGWWLPSTSTAGDKKRRTRAEQHAFQVRILKDEEAIFFLNFNFNERRAVMGYTHNQEHTEKIVLEGDNFPDIQLYQPFRVNVQVISDCIVASFWLTNLDLSMPMPLPEKHIWCTRDYSYGQDVSFDIDTLEAEDHQHHDSQDEQEQDSQEQDSQEENSHEKEGSNEIKLVSTVIYNGFIYM
ncbi:uncharacterized protein LOC126998608 isoform X2 [Eriocheir sinensis]|uniref:uncharacterized protein LOC126998608 isoform X2 n=1 Tax=Eriocheir sinensis TaxID=95602 RepID=UPI0021C65137|nr:uncharacterized protein LOC126998608 isoform X2 [Eriocheir sinensis]